MICSLTPSWVTWRIQLHVRGWFTALANRAASADPRFQNYTDHRLLLASRNFWLRVEVDSLGSHTRLYNFVFILVMLLLVIGGIDQKKTIAARLYRALIHARFCLRLICSLTNRKTINLGQLLPDSDKGRNIRSTCQQNEISRIRANI